jgi:hypothetical protein
VINKHFLGHGYAIYEENRMEIRSVEDQLEEKSVIVQIRTERDENGASCGPVGMERALGSHLL